MYEKLQLITFLKLFVIESLSNVKSMGAFEHCEINERCDIDGRLEDAIVNETSDGNRCT